MLKIRIADWHRKNARIYGFVNRELTLGIFAGGFLFLSFDRLRIKITLSGAGGLFLRRCMATRLVLIRHGETDWNAQSRYLGSTDVGLNSNGFAQAAELSRRLDRSRIDHVYASDRLRAIEFAGILFPGFRIEQVPFLREMDFGLFEGMTHGELMVKHPGLYGKWLADPFTVPIPGGEAFDGFASRIREGVSAIIARHRGKVVALVTHSGPIRLMLRDHGKTEDFWAVETKNASLYTIEVE